MIRTWVNWLAPERTRRGKSGFRGGSLREAAAGSKGEKRALLAEVETFCRNDCSDVIAFVRVGEAAGPMNFGVCGAGGRGGLAKGCL